MLYEGPHTGIRPVPTLSEFNAGAFVVEQGITNPAVPTGELAGGVPIPAGVDPRPEPEIDQGSLDAAEAFVLFLAPPAPARLPHEGRRGRTLFHRIGCAACHIPVLPTGDNPVGALRRQEVAACTDLLLHAMGGDLADMCLGLATPSEFRAEPLMGLHLMSNFLHDGRARTLEQALLLHGGKAAPSRRRFTELSDSDRAALLIFRGSP